MDYIKHLSNKDKVMEKLIKNFGSFSIKKKDSSKYFQELIDIIIGQQLSVKAAATIKTRFFDSIKSIDSKTIAALEVDEMRSIGLSTAKAKYINGLAQMIEDKSLNLNELNDMDDHNAIEELTKIKGIGKWSAEMFLIFSLGRTNIFSYGDLGLRNAFDQLYGANLSTLEKEVIIESWSPYKSFASLYLWRFLDNKPVLTND